MGNEMYADKTVVWQPGKSIRGKSGQKLIVIIPTPRCVVDSHIHIENGACTPLPLLWDKNELIRGWKRKTIDFLGEKVGHFIGLGEGGKLQVMSTVSIADRAVRDNDLTFSPDGRIMSSDFFRHSDFFSPMIIMPMDMEYAHIAGYDGQTIYHTDEFPWYYHRRISGAEPEQNGLKVELPGETTKSFSHWKVQYKDTVTSAKNNPLKLIPMYHYEPRGWRGNSGSGIEKTRWDFGAWDYPFKEVVTAKQNGIFFGFKMYTPLGYQPLDPVLTHLWQHSGNKSGCYYGKCEDEGIPILAHCSPGGMTSHEMLYYRELHRENPQKYCHTPFEFQDEYKKKNPDAGKNRSGQISSYSADYEMEYFYRYHVHPKAWRKVLEKFPKLKLCLAHFGGDEWQKGVESDWVREIVSLMEDYPGVYADFSCHDIKKNGPAFRHVLSYAKNTPVYERLLFGTDWYMTMLALKGKGYKQFCEEYWELIDDKDLWLRFTFLNPFEFYGFNDEAKLKNLYDGIRAEVDNDKENRSKRQERIEKNYSSFRRMLKQYSKLKDKLGGRNAK